MRLKQGQYGQQPWCNQLQTLVRIVLNTLDNQFHQCKRIPAIVVMGGPPSKSRGNLKSWNNSRICIFYIYFHSNLFIIFCIKTDHDLSGNAVGDIETENMPIISTYQRSPGGHGQFHMKTHWEDSGFISHYSKKHSRFDFINIFQKTKNKRQERKINFDFLLIFSFFFILIAIQ